VYQTNSDHPLHASSPLFLLRLGRLTSLAGAVVGRVVHGLLHHLSLLSLHALWHHHAALCPTWSGHHHRHHHHLLPLLSASAHHWGHHHATCVLTHLARRDHHHLPLLARHALCGHHHLLAPEHLASRTLLSLLRILLLLPWLLPWLLPCLLLLLLLLLLLHTTTALLHALWARWPGAHALHPIHVGIHLHLGSSSLVWIGHYKATRHHHRATASTHVSHLVLVHLRRTLLPLLPLLPLLLVVLLLLLLLLLLLQC